MRAFPIIVLAGLTGCVTAPVDLPEHSTQTVGQKNAKLDAPANRLAYYGRALSLPEDWEFFGPRDPLRRGILFQFRSPEGLKGCVEHISFTYDISAQKVAEYFASNILGRFKDVDVVEKESRSGRAFEIEGSYSGHRLRAMLLANGRNVDICQIIGLEKAMQARSVGVTRLLQSFAVLPEASHARATPSGFGFHCFDGGWAWADDFRSGFFVKHIGSDAPYQDLVIGVWPMDEKARESLDTREDFDIVPFEAIFFINNTRMSSLGRGYRNAGGYMKLYFPVRYSDKDYCLFISARAEESGEPLVDVYRSEHVADLFRFCLFLPLEGKP